MGLGLGIMPLLSAWFTRGLLSAPLVGLALGLGDTGRRRLARVGTAAAWIAVALGARLVMVEVRWRLGTPTEWDFLCFWLFGRATWLGRDPYAPASMHEIPLPLVPTAAFRAEVLEVGSLYPPPTMLLFAPFGAFDFHTAQLLWYALQVLAAAGCVWLLGRLFFAGTPLRRGLFGAALLLALPQTQSTFAYGQTHLLVLLLTLLAFRDANRSRLGAWIALGVAIKPWVAILALVPLLRRDWRSMGVLTATASALLLASLALLGPESFSSFFADPPALRRGANLVVTEPSTQSLPIVALRFSAGLAPLTADLWRGLAIAASLAILAASVWLVYSRLRCQPAASLVLLVATSLLVYPGTLWHYSAMLALPLAWLWSAWIRSSGRPAAGAWMLAIPVVLMGEMQWAWRANALTWLLVAVACAQTRPEPGKASPGSAPLAPA